MTGRVEPAPLDLESWPRRQHFEHFRRYDNPWFNLCADRRIRTIRLFQDAAGWTPHYSESGVDENFQPVCFGMTHFAMTS